MQYYSQGGANRPPRFAELQKVLGAEIEPALGVSPKRILSRLRMPFRHPASHRQILCPLSPPAQALLRRRVPHLPRRGPRRDGAFLSHRAQRREIDR